MTGTYDKVTGLADKAARKVELIVGEVVGSDRMKAAAHQAEGDARMAVGYDKRVAADKAAIMRPL